MENAVNQKSRKEQAAEYFLSGYNCSQSVIAAYCDLFDTDRETALKFTEGFGGGMGRLRSVCGTVTAMFMLSGLKFSKAKPKDLETRTITYAKVRELAGKFAEKNGSYICGELLKGIPLSDGSVPTERNADFYKKRPCLGCIKDSCDLIEKYLLDNNE